MCLGFPHQTEPVLDTRIRWKVLAVDGRRGLTSPIYDVVWHVGSQKRAYDHCGNGGSATSRQEYFNIGIHCFTDKQHAIDFASNSDSGCCMRCVVKLEVAGLNAAGKYDFVTYGKDMKRIQHNVPCETWKRATLLQVFNATGKKDVTHLYYKYKAEKGDTVRLKGKKQTAIVRSNAMTIGNHIVRGACGLDKPLGGLKYWNQDELELVSRAKQ